MGEPEFWVFVAFVVFFGAMYSSIKNAILGYLDSSISFYSKMIEDSDNLCNTNIELLSLAQEKRNVAEEEKRKIVSHAKNEAKRIEKLLQEQRVKLLHHGENLLQKRYELGLREIETQLYKNITFKAIEKVKSTFLQKSN